ncbi:MAG: hypothetical protein RLZZ297_423 [Chloroflexota bacterium]
MRRIPVLLLSGLVCTLVLPALYFAAPAYAEDRLLPTAAIVPPTYTPVPATATAEPLPTAIPTATEAAAVVVATSLPTAVPEGGSEGRSQEPSAPLATVVAATALPEPTAAPADPVVAAPADDGASQPAAQQPAPVVSAPIIQPTAIVLPTAAPLIPMTEPLSKNPALQSSTGIVNSLHVWGTQPLVMLMLICGFAGIGFLYYGQKN